MPAAGARRAARGGPLSRSGFRCSTASEDRSELLAGSASTVNTFLLLEHTGAWGIEALRDSRLPEGLGSALSRAAAEAKVRVLLVRRPDRSAVDGHRVFAVSARPRNPWVEAGVLDHPADVLDLDLHSLRAGHSVGLDRHDQPLFCVCTHGRHDACCAERGRPVAGALAEAYPRHTWEVSHLGGDRFAGNMLLAPDGLYYGRLTPEAAVEVARARLAGELELDHLRGRTGYPMPVQAAEIGLRRELGLTRLGGVRLTARTVEGPVTTATFDTVHPEAGRAAYAVRVRSTRGDPVRLTCRAARDQPPIRHEVLDVTPTG
ncbi:sucrase ferredoxin [Nocardioides cheoyonin]|uniref:sucrase ferredoxin n=1 Tax=Nocardioides cheoyonin TaxID=3156615 RepID=UPI0032B46C6E